MEAGDLEKGLLRSGEEPHQQVIPREDTESHLLEVSGSEISCALVCVI